MSNFNYLGTVFNYTGTFVMNQETFVGKGLTSLNVLLYNTKRFNCLNPQYCANCLMHLLDLHYACEIWGFGKSKCIERIHLKFCKALLKVKTSTSNAGCMGSWGGTLFTSVVTYV